MRAASAANRFTSGPTARLWRLARRCPVFAQPASEAEIRRLHAMFAERTEAPIASADTACRIAAASPLSVWAIRSAKALLGGLAFLPLNNLGLYRLIYGTLDRAEPPLEAIAAGAERPAILYVWALVARPRGLLGLPEILRQLDTQRFRGIDIWADPVTERGERLARRLGFVRAAHGTHPFHKFARSRA